MEFACRPVGFEEDGPRGADVLGQQRSLGEAGGVDQTKSLLGRMQILIVQGATRRHVAVS